MENYVYPIKMFNGMLLLHPQIDLLYDIKIYIMQLYIYDYCQNATNMFHFSCLCSPYYFNLKNKKTIDNSDIFIFNDRYYGMTPTQILIESFANKRFDVVEFIINDVKDDHICRILHNLYHLGKFEILKKYFSDSLHYGNIYLLQICCTHNHYEIAKYMLSVSEFTQCAIFEIFIEQCKTNNLEIVKLLTAPQYVDEAVIKKNLTANDYEALKMTCFYNSIDVFLWLEFLLIRYACNVKLLVKQYDKKRIQCHDDMQSHLKRFIMRLKIIDTTKKIDPKK